MRLALSHFRRITVGAVKVATKEAPALAETSVESVFSASAAVAFANFRVLSALWQLVDHKSVRMDYESAWKHHEAARSSTKMIYHE